MNKLIIGSRSFNIDKENSSLNYSIENNKIISCDIEFNFLEESYKGEKMSPVININTIPLNVEKLTDIKGKILSTNTKEESETREDYLMLYESEPFEKLTVEIISIENSTAHIKLSGVAFTSPQKKEEFKLEATIKVSSYAELKKNNKEKTTNYKPKNKDKVIGNTIISIIFTLVGLYALVTGTHSIENIIGCIIIIIFGLGFAFFTWKHNR